MSQGSKLAFKKACKPIIGLDRCPLKSKYLPLAFAMVENETKDSWK